MSFLKCPNCNGTNIGQQRRMEGPIWCNDCNYTIKNKQTDKSFINMDVKSTTVPIFDDKSPMTVIELLTDMKNEIGSQSYVNKIQMMMAIEVIRDQIYGTEASELATTIREMLHGE